MNQHQLHDNVTRWLNQERYVHSKEKNDDTVFQFKIGDAVNHLHVFESKKQKGILLIGIEINPPPKLNNLYKKLYNDNQREKLKIELEKRAQSNKIELQFHDEPWGVKLNLYIVIDNKEDQHFTFFVEQLNKIVDVSDSMSKFLFAVAFNNASDLKQQKGR
jgi:hypothetical protein